MHSPTGPYLKGKEKYLFPDLQRICSHWTRSRNAESSNPSTMSWKNRHRSQHKESGSARGRSWQLPLLTKSEMRLFAPGSLWRVI